MLSEPLAVYELYEMYGKVGIIDAFMYLYRREHECAVEHRMCSQPCMQGMSCASIVYNRGWVIDLPFLESIVREASCHAKSGI